jgi:hypothetical protein
MKLPFNVSDMQLTIVPIMLSNLSTFLVNILKIFHCGHSPIVSPKILASPGKNECRLDFSHLLGPTLLLILLDVLYNSIDDPLGK